MRIAYVSMFLLGFCAAIGAAASLYDYAAGIERYSRWGTSGPTMALNTATLILALGIATMLGAATGERLLDASNQKKLSAEDSSSSASFF